MSRHSSKLRQLYAGYARNQNIPLKGYTALLGTYAVLFGGALWAAKRRNALPEKFPAKDLAQFAVATHEASLLLTRDAVTSAIRAPFTRYLKASIAGEVDEVPRGQGLQEVVGELLTCPFCMQTWIAGALLTGVVFKPRETRFVVSVLCTIAGSSFLHNSYSLTQAWAENSDK